MGVTKFPNGVGTSDTNYIDPIAGLVLTTQSAAELDYTITWTANEPTAGDSATIADGTVPTVAELGQAVADITAKLNTALAALRANGIIAP
jgi:hypothetical protein